ncbi:phosphocholine cytidylyltransferase family protein [Candidatus Woesearchaeota archaeon]|nr:phosphocholine cytidylyltransferase family protein [Candidatus Woesearchaeota archaeon]
MLAVIVAAGMGTRLGKYTKNLPKGMLPFNGKSLIQWQVDTLRAAGIDDIIIVRGYNPEKIDIKGVEYRINKAYADTNMVATLMEAKEDMLAADGVLVCYSDVLYEKRLITELLEFSGAVGVLVDDDWQTYWQARMDDWKSDVESLQFDAENNITDLGNTACSLAEAQARYVGLIRFSVDGVKKLVQSYEENEKKFWDSDAAWKRSKSFKKAYMTCMLQELVDTGVPVKAVHTEHGWMEFDTVDDYELAVAWQKEGNIGRFIDLAGVGSKQ